MIPHIRFGSGISLKKSLMAIIIIIILISLISITAFYFLETSRQIDSRFYDDINQSEFFLKSTSDRITKGQMLWEATYRKPLEAVTDLVIDEYEAKSRDPSQINFRGLINKTDITYRDRIDILLINNTGVGEYSTNGKDLNLDFSKWGPFYQTITDMRMNNTFRLDRAVRGFDTNNPWRIFAYQPTPDHEYLIETTYRIYDDYKEERGELSLNALVTQVMNQDKRILDLDLIGSTGTIISKVDEIPVPVDPDTFNISMEVYASHAFKDIIDEKNKTITRYFFIESGDHTSPASEYVDFVGKLVISTREYKKEKTFLLTLAISLLLFSIIMAFLLAYLLSRFFFSPVEALIEDLDIISRGDINHPIRQSRHQEINRIAKAASSMIDSIKQYIQSLESSEKRYYSLFTNASDAIILWDGTEILSANPAAYSLFGWEESDTQGDESSYDQVIQTLMAGRKGTNTEWEENIEIPGTKTLSLNIHTVSFNIDNRTLDLIEIRDITEEKLMHEEIHRLADIVRNTQAGIIAGPVNKPLIVNEAYARMHGYTQEEALDKGFFGLVNPENKANISEWIRIASETGHMTGETLRIRKDSTEFPALHDLTIVKEAQSEPYVILNVQDITDQLEVWKLTHEKETLSNSLNLLNRILAHLPDPTIVIDTEGKVISWNQAMEDFTHITFQDLLDGKITYASAIYHTNDRPLLIDKVIHPDLDVSELYSDIRFEDGLYSAEVTHQSSDGEFEYYSGVAAPLYDSKGTLIGAIERVRDITELRRALKKQSELNNKLMLLSSLTRHDIRNKVTVIDGFRFFVETETHEEKVKEILALQKKAIIELGKLIDFSKSYQEIGIHEPAWHNVRDMFERAVRQVSIELIVACTIPNMEIYADSLISQVFYNLAENSVRHGINVSSVSLSYEYGDESCRLIYEDDGKGIPDEEKEQIFLRGYGKNTGLGLFFIREILAITDIQISEKGTYGTGARFEIFIPHKRFRILSDEGKNPTS